MQPLIPEILGEPLELNCQFWTDIRS